MVTANLKNYQEEDIIMLIEQIKDGNLTASVSDLKAILAEINNRKLDSSYANIICELLKIKITDSSKQEPTCEETAKKIEKQDVEDIQEQTISRRIVQKPNSNTYEKRHPIKAENDEECQKYPILTFLVGLGKVLGWIMFTICVLLGMVLAIGLYLKNILMFSVILVVSIGIGLIFLVSLYGFSERTQLYLDIEKHLSKNK